MKLTTITGRLGADATQEEYAAGKFVMKMSAYVDGLKKDEKTIIEVLKYSNEPFKNLSLFTKGAIIEAYGNHSCSAYLGKEGEPRVGEKLTTSFLSVLHSENKNVAENV